MTVSWGLARFSLENHVRFKNNELWKGLIMFMGKQFFVPCKIFSFMVSRAAVISIIHTLF